MTNIFIIVALLVFFFFFAQKYLIRQDDSKDYNYKKNGPILTSAESSLFNALRAAVGEHGIVLAKVGLPHLISPSQLKNKKQWFIAQSRIAKQCVSFVICDPRSLEPRVVVEFNDGKPLTKAKIEREKLLLHVCQSANIPIIGTNIKHSYQVGKLRRLLAAHIDLIEPDKEVRFCKRCGSPMVIKTATQGEFKGRRFFTCSRQPHCTYTENYNVVFETDETESNKLTVQ